MSNNWISVKERLPESHMEVLVYGKHYLRKKHMIAVAEYDHKWSWWNQCGVSGFDTEWDMAPDSITHWMPLPEPPNSDNNTNTFSEVSGKVTVGM